MLATMSSLALWLAVAGALPLLLYLYVRTNDAKIAALHPDAVKISPARWDMADVRRTAEAQRAQLQAAGRTSLFTPGELPPKTGRRYIVIGGVSGRVLYSSGHRVCRVFCSPRLESRSLRHGPARSRWVFPV